MTEQAAGRPDKERLWTPANIVTLVRICCVPVFVVAIISPWPAWFPSWNEAASLKPWIAAAIFVLLAATDGLDGYLARSRNEVTNFGKFMDPLADKILVAAALLALVELSVLPSWPALIILTREFIVSGIRMVAASQGVVIAASWYGKAKTVTQIIAIVLFIVKDGIVVVDPAGALHNPLYLLSWAVMLVALVLTVVSMLDYFAKARVLLGFTSDASANSEGENAVPCRTEAPDDEEVSLSEVEALAKGVVDAARCAKTHVGTAESLTGGLIAGALTSVPGSSEVVRGGVASYASEVKRDVLGVDGALLEREGAVCEAVACQMALGAAIRLGADATVAVTGIAGPGGAEPGHPVGTVWLAVATGGSATAHLRRFSGNREQIRLKTVRCALRLLLGEIRA